MSDLATSTERASAAGLTLSGLLVGLLTGIGVYLIGEYWVDLPDSGPVPVTLLAFVITAAASYLLLTGPHRVLRAALGALVIAAILAIPDYWLVTQAEAGDVGRTDFPIFAWFMLARGLTLFLLLTLTKAAMEEGAPPPYREVFFHGITLPLIAAGAKLIAGLSLLLLFAWAKLLETLGVEFFKEFFQESWFILPFLGAVGGASIALMRAQQAVLGALRFVLLLFCRILMPITALFTVTLLIVLVAKGTDPLFDRWHPGGWLIALALAGMLIFNGVYQNGEGGAPPLWLRISSLIALVGFPVYSGLAAYAFLLRIEDYGLTPPRIAGLAVTALTAAYSIVCIAGLLSEANWRAKRWMAPVAPLNTAMAALWAAALFLMASPLVNMWAISADSQVARLAKEKVDASEFDYGYLRFRLGAEGEEALDELLALTDHPQAGEIAAGVARARAAKNRWEYQNPELMSPTPAEPVDPDGPMGLEFIPEGADLEAGD